MSGRRAFVLVCLALVMLPLAACEEPTAPPLVVPSGPTVYVTTNNTVNVYPTATAAAIAPPPASAPPPVSEAPPAPSSPPRIVRRAAEPTRRASVGVVECDQYIARLERCTAGMSDKFETMLDTMWENYKFAARSADGRTSLAIGCRGGLKMIDCDTPP